MIVPADEYFTSIDGVYCELPDRTHIAFVTFPKMGPNHDNRGILFYGHIAKAFFDYYRDLRDAHPETQEVVNE